MKTEFTRCTHTGSSLGSDKRSLLERDMPRSGVAGFILFVLLIGVAATLIVIRSNFPISSTASIGLPLPNVEFETLSGKTADLGCFEGSPLLVVFLDLECGFCLEQFNVLSEICRRNRWGLTTIVIVRDNPGISAAGNSLSSYPFEIWVDPHHNTRKKFGNIRAPSFFYIDRYGILRYKLDGVVTADLLDSLTFNSSEL